MWFFSEKPGSIGPKKGSALSAREEGSPRAEGDPGVFLGPSARPKALGRRVLAGLQAPMGFDPQKQSRGLSASKASKSHEN